MDAAPAIPTTAGEPITVRIPDPGNLGRVIRRAIPFVLIGTVAACLILTIPDAVPVWLLLPIGAPAIVLVAIDRLVTARRSRSIVLERRAFSVAGLPAGELPAGGGRLIVDADADPPDGLCGRACTVSFEGDEIERTVIAPETSLRAVHDLALALCRLGGYELVWRDAAGEEVRAADEVDVPLVARPDVSTHAREDGDAPIEIDGGHRGPRATLLLLAFGCAMMAGLWLLNSTTDARSMVWPELFGSLGVAIGLWLLLLVAGLVVRRRAIVSREGVRVETRLAGLLVRHRLVPASTIVGVSIVRGPWSYGLLLLGDGICTTALWRTKDRSLTMVVEARRQVISALLDGQAVA